MAEGQTTKGLNKPCILLIVIAGMERFAFKGVASNLVTYLTDVVKMSNSSAAKTVNSWCGFTSLLPLLVAPLADSYWDQYTTILVSSFLYVLGLIALASTALVRPWIPINNANPSSSLLWSLYMISLGQGGYNPSLQAFGADQLENEDEALPVCTKNDQISDKKSLFFQWWYFGVCSGSLLGVSLMAYIQDTLGWGLGFAIPTIVMVTSVLFFSCGSRFYAYKQAKEDGVKMFEKIIHAVKATASKMLNIRFALSNKSDLVELELQEKPLCHQDLDVTGDLNKRSNGAIHPREIAEVILHLLPIWTTLLMFAVIFQQPATFFTKQGMTMKRNIGTTFKIPPATLQSAITVSIILLMPLYDTLFIPFTRLLTRNEKGIGVMQRMGIGMILSVIAMVIAAIVETKRLDISRKTQSQIVPLSIFWLLPQYILLGISDIFTVVGMQQFFYSEVPVQMRTMGIALYTSVFGVGSFLSAFFISLVEYFTKSWFSDDMSEARLDKYYWLLAMASALSFLIFVIFCGFYKSRV
ncbi:Protein NRT1/ PTR FAMILY 5.8 like [Actinidia chinensis var. chinensis]|uniref:Protein NRT1/ PTR FAMILY 5.8 like n=1 Tax=Actinidia chinensis var. chinensis TaxID=1590841 RepID=A0A2R6RUM2_ACTCC|nr:Protein NRT1/ PTR FAMILY 5.8 like [Actinidia chinensis var. chinensis]